jgi:hypothetical protein
VPPSLETRQAIATDALRSCRCVGRSKKAVAARRLMAEGAESFSGVFPLIAKSTAQF